MIMSESYRNFKDIRIKHKTFTDKTQPCNHEQELQYFQIYHKTIAANKIYYKRQVYAAREFLYRQDFAKGKTLVALVLGSL